MDGLVSSGGFEYVATSFYTKRKAAKFSRNAFVISLGYSPIVSN